VGSFGSRQEFVRWAGEFVFWVLLDEKKGQRTDRGVSVHLSVSRLEPTIKELGFIRSRKAHGLSIVH